MNELRYIKLFEAFDSNTLRSVFKYVSKYDRKEFITKLKNICGNFEFPMDELSESMFKYMPYNSALNYQKDFDKDEVSTVKFWFDKDGRYICDTSIGNLYMESRSDLDDNMGLIITDQKLLNNYDTGTKFIFADDDSTKVLAILYKSGDKTYMIQDEYSGTRPSGDDWREYGTCSYRINSNSDFTFLALYDDTKSSPPHSNREFNAMIDNGSTIYVGDKMCTKPVGELSDKLKNANFALLLDVSQLRDKSKSGNIKDLKSLRSKRVKSREGATSFMKNEEFMQMNIDRYIDKISNNIKIDPSIYIGFQKIIMRMIGGKYCGYFILGKNISIDSLDYIMKKFYLIYKSSDNSALIEQMLRMVRQSYIENISVVKTVKNSVSKCNNKLTGDSERDILLKLSELNDIIYNGIVNSEMKCPEDVYILHTKIKHIRESRTDDMFYPIDQLYKFFNNTKYDDDDSINCISRAAEGSIEELILGMDRFIQYVKNYLK